MSLADNNVASAAMREIRATLEHAQARDAQSERRAAASAPVDPRIWRETYIAELVASGCTREVAIETYEAVAIEGGHRYSADARDAAREIIAVNERHARSEALSKPLV